MSHLSEDGAAPSGSTAAAGELVRRGAAAHPPGIGPARRLMRRMLLRLSRPFGAYQEEVNRGLWSSVQDVDARVQALERLQLDLLAEDLAAGLDSLRARVAGAEEVTDAARALPYVAAGVLEQFSDPRMGVVVGFRDGGAAPEQSYKAFEDAFRGPESRVSERQAAYLPLLEPGAPVLDAGCGRGELLDLLRERGVPYAGVDNDPDMVRHCRDKGHADVEHVSANDHLRGLPDESLGTIFSAQVIEHMPFDELKEFLRLSQAKLRPGGAFVAETVNPHAPHALKAFWVDPTHRHPLFPEVTLVLCRLAGFESGYVFHPLGTGHVEDDRFRESEYAVVARKA
jgi:SAM-dependent methyltransferase